MIKKVKGGYRLFSHKTGKPLGPVRKSKAGAQKDLRRVQYYKKQSR